MSIRDSKIRTVAALLAAAAPGVLLAQPPGANDNVKLPESRKIPAEQTAAAYANPDWKAPRT